MTTAMPDKQSTTHVKPKRISRRRRSRELVLQGVYQWRVAGGTTVFIEDQLRQTNEFKKVDEDFFSILLCGVLNDSEALEKQIQPFLDRPFSKLSPVEFSILLLGTYELTNRPEIPYQAVINEAIELARRYGSVDGYKYVNGVLDKLAVELRTIETQTKN